MESIEIHSRNALKYAKNPHKIEQQIYNAINKIYPSNHSHRMFIAVMVDVFEHVIQLIVINQLPSAYVEMHSLVEESAIRFFPKNLKIKDNKSILMDLIDRKTLKDLIPYYVELGLWNKEDAIFAKRIANIRNGVAHRNFDLLFKHIGGKSNPNYKPKYDNVNFKTNDCINALAQSIDLCTKVYKTNSRSKKKL